MQAVVENRRKKKERNMITKCLRPTEISPSGLDLCKVNSPPLVFTSVQQACGAETCIKVQTGVGEGRLQDQNGHQGLEGTIRPCVNLSLCLARLHSVIILVHCQSGSVIYYYCRCKHLHPHPHHHHHHQRVHAESNMSSKLNKRDKQLRCAGGWHG